MILAATGPAPIVLVVFVLAVIWLIVLKHSKPKVDVCPICGSPETEPVPFAPSLVGCVSCGVQRHRDRRGIKL